MLSRSRRRGSPIGAAAGVLRFSEERDPAMLAQFVRLRVTDPERAYWRRGIEAAGRWLRKTGNTVLQVPYTVVTPEDWGGVGGYPLGQWIADQRHTYTAGAQEAWHVAELEQPRMVWSEQEAAWADRVAVAKEYAPADAQRRGGQATSLLPLGFRGPLPPGGCDPLPLGGLGGLTQQSISRH
ncbi:MULTISPECIES: helicase associated domain-containing protein [unclassified Streptomyces]|uniref:helicase associated domain-containing protein n=1 Tax=unclassified Streptomyces TaxID=2593676 RepID=UPI00225A1EF9|nr:MULTISPECIES: helicase associated domain-containing protein [unclassified Streptomyces]WTB61096.1 helicase associated domain-containing protein [Streptomyces sp. NBC_00826]WTH96237.1 helicase associated domain-containing protein [Streptomyces sp. NBC_00825]WTI04740.1 helicase associated domain-containing protein [Streptomyces sp. NBC_00822]MCX4870629.1 helicase associated domain-containing protein [Streptomyces sp. NBC_00906]MCX4901894.1 helicase associated domain-containing protein [Strept